MTQITIAKKGSPEFKAACQQYLKLMDESKEPDFIKKGMLPDNKYLGLTSKKVLEAKLPMPFGCPDLFIQACFETLDKGKLTERSVCTGIIWFCDRIGCICVCCREDFTKPQEEYPNYCPSPASIMDHCADGDCDGCPDRFDCPESPESQDPDDWEEDFDPDW